MAEETASLTRDDYYRACIRNGAPEKVAASIADALMTAQSRRLYPVPGWENLVRTMPKEIKDRSVLLYNVSAISFPPEDPTTQHFVSLDAVFTYGVFVGMALAERGHLMSQAEREASTENMTNIWTWIESLEKKD